MNWRSRAARLLREPLVHFLVAGALVYVLLSGRAPDLGERRIVVNGSVVANLAMRWTESYRRPPSPEELDGLLADYVKDQVYYREALRLGLDKEDEVVMRRLRNKMVVLATSDTEAAKPDDQVLRNMIAANPARYAPEAQFGFEQVFLGGDTPAARNAIPAALVKLRHNVSPFTVGEPVPIPESFQDTAASNIAALFGDEFVQSLRSLPIDQWSGPVLSGLGLHAVRVTTRSTSATPQLGKVRQQVENDWRTAARQRAEADAYKRILTGYDVVIEQQK